MGTDIRCHAEGRGDGGWESIGSDFYCGADDRQGGLITILTGGWDAEEGGFDPIAPHRGFPTDSRVVGHLANSLEGYWSHARTWVTLRELLDFPWHDMKVNLLGYVDSDDFLRHRCGDKAERTLWRRELGPLDRIVSHGEMERRINRDEETTGIVTPIGRGMSYATCVGPFVSQTLPFLQQQGEPDDIRLIVDLTS